MSSYIRVFEEQHSYFITVVTEQRRAILLDNIDLLRRSFYYSKKRYAYTIDAIVILPDHFHMIITPKNHNDYPKIISHIKRSFVYGLNKEFKKKIFWEQSLTSRKRKLAGVWQKRFYEHTLRHEKDFNLHLAYIQNNPVKHGYIGEDGVWEYSSFFKY